MATQNTVKTKAKNKEAELTQGRPVIQVDPNLLTIVTSKHPLAKRLYLSRNDNKYEDGSNAVEEFKNTGQLQPIGVFPYNNDGTKEMIVAFGNQRVLKCRAAGIKVDTVVFDDWTVNEAEHAMTAENMQREDLNFADQLRSVVRRISFHKETKTKNAYGAVATEFNRGTHQWARDMEAVSRLPKEVLRNVGNPGEGKSLSFAAAIQLAKVGINTSDPEKRKEEQIAAFKELLNDETAQSAKGGIKTSKASNKAAGKKTKDVLSSAEWRLIAANEEIDFSELTDEQIRLLISAVLGDIDVLEARRAGLEFVKHVDVPKERKNGRKKKEDPDKAKKVREAIKKQEAESLENLNFDDDDDEEDVDVDVEDFEDDDDEE